MAELKPCPFCGHKAVVERKYVEYWIEPYFYVTCLHCNSRGPYVETEEEAIEAWNRRS